MAKEYIERKALLQDIVETVVFSTKTGERNSEIKGANKVIGRIQAQPTADVVEVIRCKDCIYHIAEYCTRDIKGRTNMFYMTAEDFCSYGVKKE